ncbi:MAG: GNAT family N-acetyltransferase [Candidatus Nanoarchaeia archaeon]
MEKNKIIIRDYKNNDKEKLIGIWSEAFRSPTSYNFQKELKEFYNSLNPKEITISELEGKVNGFVKAIELKKQESLLDYLNNIINLAIQKDKDTLKYFQEGFASIHGGKVEVNIHKNPYNLRLNCLTKNDILISEIAVDKSMQGKGIGKRLLRRSLEKSITKNAKYYITCCWNGSYSKELFTRMGFKPIVTLRPVYLDGESGTDMIKKIR